jgi:hypothetical protein
MLEPGYVSAQKGFGVLIFLFKNSESPVTETTIAARYFDAKLLLLIQNSHFFQTKRRMETHLRLGLVNNGIVSYELQ